MSNIILINKAVRALILSDSEVSKKLNGQTFSIVGDDTASGVSFPFCVLKRVSTRTINHKDQPFYKQRVARVQVTIVDDNYARSVDLASKVTDKLDGYEGTVQDIQITDLTLADGNEEYMNGAFVQNLYFDVEVVD